jgi:methionyl-tRNA formyltransferase
MKITILCTDHNHPVIYYLCKWINELSIKGHIVSLVFDRSELSGGDILFLVSCSQMIREAERCKYKANLVLHASDLPMGRGWSPHIWSILDGNSLITVSLLEAAEPVDSGPIWLKTTFSLEGHELLDEINKKLFEAELYLMTEAVEQFSYIKPIQQAGEPGEYMRKRSSEDSRIDPYKSISDQFNLLRVVDSERYPAFFEYQGMKYLIKIEKVKSE